MANEEVTNNFEDIKDDNSDTVELNTSTDTEDVVTSESSNIAPFGVNDDVKNFVVIAPYGVNVRKYDSLNADIQEVKPVNDEFSAVAVSEDWVRIDDEHYVYNKDYILKEK